MSYSISVVRNVRAENNHHHARARVCGCSLKTMGTIPGLRQRARKCDAHVGGLLMRLSNVERWVGRNSWSSGFWEGRMWWRTSHCTTRGEPDLGSCDDDDRVSNPDVLNVYNAGGWWWQGTLWCPVMGTWRSQWKRIRYGIFFFDLCGWGTSRSWMRAKQLWW